MISPGMSSCEHSLNTLRYADRVKELAATDPTEMKAEPINDDKNINIEDQTNNSYLSESDLAQLISLNVSPSQILYRSSGLNVLMNSYRKVNCRKIYTPSTKRCQLYK